MCGLLEEEKPEAQVGGLLLREGGGAPVCAGEGGSDANGEVPGLGDNVGGVVELADEALEVVVGDGVVGEVAEDAGGVGEALVFREGDEMQARGDIPTEEVLFLGEASLGFKLGPAEGVRAG